MNELSNIIVDYKLKLAKLNFSISSKSLFILIWSEKLLVDHDWEGLGKSKNLDQKQGQMLQSCLTHKKIA